MRRLTTLGILAGLLLFAATARAAETRLSELLKALNSADPSARLVAIDDLGRMGPRAAEAVPALTDLLKNDSAAVRAHAAQALGEIGPPAKSAVPALVRLITDPDPAVRRKVVGAVRNLRPGPEVVVPLAVKVLKDADPSVRNRALDALAEAGPPAVPTLIELLKDKQTAYWASLVVAEIGPEARAAVPALTALLDTPDLGERREAMLALAAIGEASAPATEALAKSVDCPVNRVPATYALGKIGKVPAEVERKIEANAKSDDPILSTVSTWALARFHPDDRELVSKAVAQLVEGLKRPERRQREAAARALVELNADPEITRPIMKRAMEGAPPATIEAALDALAALGEQVVPRAIEALVVPEVRAKAAAMIARIGPPAKAAVPALIKALGDDDPATRSEVLMALGAIGPDAQAAVPAVIKALHDPEVSVRYAACYALGKIGPAALPAEGDLQNELSAEDPFLRVASAWALARIHPECAVTAAKSVPVLVKALGEPNVTTRLEAAESLGCLGPLAKDAIPALNKAKEDRDPAVREAAAEALKAIRR
jgi:HEAT repeat protein